MIITDYTILEHDSIEKLVAEVKQYCEKGWQPLGGVATSVTYYHDREGDPKWSSYYAQAMVKPAEITVRRTLIKH